MGILRPFKRLTNFLENIGAKITHPKDKKVTLPIKICGTKDWALAQKHEIKVKSAQITTAIIYAALQTKGITEIIESSETPAENIMTVITKKDELPVTNNESITIDEAKKELQK